MCGQDAPFPPAYSIANPADVGAWAGLIGDIIDVVVPCVSGVGEIAHGAISVAKVVKDEAKVIKKGWKVGDDIKALTKAGNIPSWSALKQRYWKNVGHYTPDLYPDVGGYNNRERMLKGLAPKVNDNGVICSMELHHPHGRKGDNFWIFEPVTPSQHAARDSFRHLGR